MTGRAKRTAPPFCPRAATLCKGLGLAGAELDPQAAALTGNPPRIGKMCH